MNPCARIRAINSDTAEAQRLEAELRRKKMHSTLKQGLTGQILSCFYFARARRPETLTERIREASARGAEHFDGHDFEAKQ